MTVALRMARRHAETPRLRRAIDCELERWTIVSRKQIISETKHQPIEVYQAKENPVVHTPSGTYFKTVVIRNGVHDNASCSSNHARSGKCSYRFAIRSGLAFLLLWIGVVFVPCLAAESPDGYYRDGPLRGSLKSDRPLPLYDADPEHLWNRLFAMFYIRPSDLPSRPKYPNDTTKLDEWDRKMRNGKLPPGPVVKRIEGGDVLGILAWPKTRYFSEPSFCRRANQLLDEFLEADGQRLIRDPLKRAFLQRDLWVVFDHLVGQNIAHFGDADLARRRAVVPDYEIEPEETQFNDLGAIRRRETLCRKLAVAIKRLALSRAAIKALPDNYAVAIRSGAFVTEHDFDPRRNYLPPGLLAKPNEWVEIDNLPASLSHDPREGQLQHTAFSIRGRSYYRVFLRFPSGHQAVEKYLAYLQREGVDWERSARQGYVLLKGSVRQIPAGTETAIVQFLVLLDEDLQPVPTHFVELVHLRIFKNVDGADDPRTNNGRGVNTARYSVRRQLLFDGLKQGGLARAADDAPTYRVLMTTPRDWGAFGRQQSVVQTCLHCHMYNRDRVGVHSLNSISCFVAERGMPGIIIPMGSGKVRVYSRGERTVRWKLGQEDYARLVEYARSDGPR